MKNNLIVGIVIGIVLTVVLVLAGVGLVSLLRGPHRTQPVSQSVPSAPAVAMDTAGETRPLPTQADQEQILINGRAYRPANPTASSALSRATAPGQLLV